MSLSITDEIQVACLDLHIYVPTMLCWISLCLCKTQLKWIVLLF